MSDTRVPGWVQSLTEEVLGGSPVEVGKRYNHPEDGVILITSGQYWGMYGLSNHWSWTVEATGENKCGYAGNWPQVQGEGEVNSAKGNPAPSPKE